MPSQAETIAALQGLNPVTTPQSPADPYAAAMTFGSAIGLPDAIKALKGQLTPEEAQNFALTSAMGLLPGGKAETAAAKTMGELLPHLYPPASTFAKMTPKEYLGMFGTDLPKVLPQDVENVLKPYMQAPPKVGKVPGPGAVQQFAPQVVPQGKLPDLTDADIAMALKKNPGASIFDVAGTHVGGESSSLNNMDTPGIEQSFPQELFRDIPREGGIQQTPLKASILGKSENLVHGTRLPAEKWETPTMGGAALGGTLDALKLPDDELGVHFGNPKQAQIFSGDWLSNQAQPRQYPVVVATNNPLELPDLGTWHLEDVAEALKKANTGELRGRAGYERRPDSPFSFAPISPETVGQFPPHEVNQIDSIEGMRDYLQSKGYDSVKYVNKAEDNGYNSFIKFAPSTEAPNFVSGVRSPFAAFDPAKIMRPELAAGLAGGTLAAPAIDPNLLKALTGSQTDQQQ
jgi:hypothetical protein